MPAPIPKPKRKAAPAAKAKAATKRTREDPIPSVLRKEGINDEPVTKRPRGRPRKQPPEVFDMTANDDDTPRPPPPPQRNRAIKKVPVVKSAAKALGEDSAPAPSVNPTRSRRNRKVPEAQPQTKKPPTRKVKIDEEPKGGATLEKKKRGNPPGSRNEKSLAVTQHLEKSIATVA